MLNNTSRNRRRIGRPKVYGQGELVFAEKCPAEEIFAGPRPQWPKSPELVEESDVGKSNIGETVKAVVVLIVVVFGFVLATYGILTECGIM